jgi:hypothetical protein
MIANWSRLSQFGKCPEKAWNWDELRLQGYTWESNLEKGGGFHNGVAEYFATRNIEAARQKVEDLMRADLKGKLVLPEDKPQIEHDIAWTKMAVARFAEHYEGQPVQVLWPEVQFCVPIPDSLHCCWEFHKRFCGDVPYNDHAERIRYQGPSPELPCWQPHYFRGKTDAVVQYLGDVWLFEHKTNSMKLEMFVERYYLDAQTTGYLYGIWKQLGTLPAGFILNVIQKPHPNSKDQMQVGFAREIFQRCREDLEAFEGEFRQQATDYESAFRDRHLGNPFAVVRRTTSCMDYSRKCAYFAKCQRHPREALEGEFAEREPDYVEAAYTEIYEKWKEEHANGNTPSAISNPA